jgi:hypothetical protein
VPSYGQLEKWRLPSNHANLICDFTICGLGDDGQLGFFDADKRLAAISAKGDPLEMIDRVVPFESFRAEIEAAVLTPADEKRSNAGRKRIDVIVMFRMLVLQSLYNFSDEQAEYHVHDRMSFTRFSAARFRGQRSGCHDAVAVP